MDSSEKQLEAVEKIAAVDSNGDLSSKEIPELNPPIGPTNRDADANGIGIGGDEESAESAAAAAAPAAAAATRTAATTKGHGLRRWRRIRRDLIKEVPTTPDSAQLHKRRLPLADPPKGRGGGGGGDEGRYDAEEESSVASIDSRIAVASPAAVVLDPELGFLIASGGFSVGADSDNSEDRSSKSSTAASAPRLRHDTLGFGRDRTRAKGAAGKGPRSGRGGDAAKKIRGGDRVVRAAAEPENSRSSVESDLRSSNAAHLRRSSGVDSNGKHCVKSVAAYYDGDHSDEGQQSEEVRSGYYKENGRVVGNLLGDDLDTDALEGSTEKGRNGGLHSDADPYVESIVLLQTAQEALECEIQKLVEIGKEPGDDHDARYDETEWSSFPHLEAPVDELNEKIKHLEYKLEEASAIIKEKDSRLLELEALIAGPQPIEIAVESNDLSSLEDKCEEMRSDLEQLLMDKVEAEIQCLVMTRASQTCNLVAEDQLALYDQQKSLSGNFQRLRHKLQHAENRAMVLEEMAEKLETQCKELSGTSEILQLKSRASRVSLFCFIQLAMLCIALGTFLMQLLPLSTEVVPT